MEQRSIKLQVTLTVNIERVFTHGARLGMDYRETVDHICDEEWQSMDEIRQRLEADGYTDGEVNVEIVSYD